MNTTNLTNNEIIEMFLSECPSCTPIEFSYDVITNYANLYHLKQNHNNMFQLLFACTLLKNKQLENKDLTLNG